MVTLSSRAAAPPCFDISLECRDIVALMADKGVPIEQLDPERAGLRRAAIHLAAMILADAAGSTGGGALSQNGAMLDLETAALRYVRRLDELSEDPAQIVH